MLKKFSLLYGIMLCCPPDFDDIPKIQGRFLMYFYVVHAMLCRYTMYENNSCQSQLNSFHISVEIL